MAHKFETGFFTGQPAWHGLGTVLDQPPSIPEAIVAAGLDWTVSLEDLITTSGQPVTPKAVKRDRDGAILGVVGPKFKPLQNDAAFNWFAPFVESGACTLEAAGALRQGARVWVLAKIAEGTSAEIVPGDNVERYLLLAHGHDGSLAVRLGFTDVRVVCQNTLTMAVGSSRLLKIKHTKNVETAMSLVREILDVQRREFAASIVQMRTLAAKECDELTLRKYVREVFAPAGKDTDDEDTAKTLQNKIVPLFESGIGMDLAGKTMWGAFNCVTEYLTYYRGRSNEDRLDSNWFGPGADLLDRAKKVALAMCRWM